MVARISTTTAALLIDAAGCFLGACIFLIAPSAWEWLDLPENWRLPVVVALFAFSVYLVTAARYGTRALIALAVLGNIAWVVGGAIALFVTGTVLGGLIIAAVMVADAVMAWLQSRGLGEQPEPVESPTLEHLLDHDS